MPPEFIRDRLFRPFDSTKGSKGMGVGAYQSREFARRMNRNLTIVSTVAPGAIEALELPLV